MTALNKSDVERFFKGSTISPFPYPDDVRMMGAALNEHGVSSEDVLMATRLDHVYKPFVMLTRTAAISAHQEGMFKKRLVTHVKSLAAVDGVTRREKKITKFEGAPGGSITLEFMASGESIYDLTWGWADRWEDSQRGVPGKDELFARGEEARVVSTFGINF